MNKYDRIIQKLVGNYSDLIVLEPRSILIAHTEKTAALGSKKKRTACAK